MPTSWALVQGTWETVFKGTCHGGAGTRWCPHPWVQHLQLTHPPSQESFACIPGPACWLGGSSSLWQVSSPASVYPPGLRAPENWSSKCFLQLGETPGPSQLEDGSARVDFWALGCHPPERKGCPVSPALPLTPAHLHVQMRVGPPGDHRASLGGTSALSGGQPRPPQPTVLMQSVCVPVGGHGTLPYLDKQRGRAEETANLRSPAPSPTDVRPLAQGTRRLVGGRRSEVGQTCMSSRAHPCSRHGGTGREGYLLPLPHPYPLQASRQPDEGRPRCPPGMGAMGCGHLPQRGSDPNRGPSQQNCVPISSPCLVAVGLRRAQGKSSFRPGFFFRCVFPM